MTVRAELVNASISGPTSIKLPVDIGPFKLDYSPNAELYLAELGETPSDRFKLEQLNSQFPMSLLYIELWIQVCHGDILEKRADDVLELLERLFRLFRPGEVSVQRHSLWEVHEDGLTRTWSFSSYAFEPVKPLASGLHDRPAHPLDDDTLGKFIEFLDVHWDGLGEIPRFLRTAMARFNSSYERRDLPDRLIDLVVALEALFGDGESGGITYKVAIRCACWLYPSGEGRATAFETVKKLYSARSKVVHGRGPKHLSTDQVDELEEMVRASLKEFLDRHAQRDELPEGKEIDNLIMTGKI